MNKQRPQVLEHGYLNVYSRLTPQERRQLYFKRLYKQQHLWWDDSTILACRILKGYLQRHKQIDVLDVGCGRGNYLVDEYRNHIRRAVGVDLEPAATRGNISLDEIRFASADKLPFADKTFDVVLALWTFEHLQNPPRH
ncbi:MAG: class I SAM-dependent methyltransferase [Candidatus Kerfeldbacteria bacterium]|nr:class I SAM-dependent methyltransferase [Candidatus Kerfeldbacteria bacterium]